MRTGTMHPERAKIFGNEPIKDADYARRMVDQTARETPSHKARLAMARLVVRMGNYTPEGLKIWADYEAAGAPAA